MLLFWGFFTHNIGKNFGRDWIGMLFSTLNVWRKHFVAILLCFMGIFPIGTSASQGKDIAYKLALSKELADVGAAVEFYQERGFEPIWVDRSRDARNRCLLYTSDAADE